MTWRLTDPQGNEAGKVKYEIVPYTRGRVLDLGCGPNKAWPHFIGVDNGHHDQAFGWENKADILVDSCEKLDLFQSGSVDAVFSSHLLEHIANYGAALREWMRVVKTGGYLILYLPDEDEYPKVGTEYANPDHKWDVNYDRVVKAMEEVPAGWDLVEFQKRNQDTPEGNEYSLLFVFQKKAGKVREHSWKLPKPDKTACVVRYGGIGDMVQTSSVIRGLKDQGFHVTLMTVPLGEGLLRHDPAIDRFIVQDKDQVPNPELGTFWRYWQRKFDRWVNLSESVEGTMLGMPNRIQSQWPAEARRHLFSDVNYLEFSHAIAGVPHKPQQKFYPTREEQEWAKAQKAKYGRCVLWSLAGSSVHKVWPRMDEAIAGVLSRGFNVVLVGDDTCAVLMQGWENEPRVIKNVGKWGVRESLAFAPLADLVTGTETGLLNAVAFESVPKIILLSHSSHNNLTRDWLNTEVLTPPVDKVPCYPCHMMHFSFENCRRDERWGTALCAAEITEEMFMAAFDRSFAERKVA